MALAGRQADDGDHDQHKQGGVDDMPVRQQDRLARHATVELQEGDDRTGEGQRADGDADRHFDAGFRVNGTDIADAEGGWCVERRRCHEDRSKADQRMEAGHKLRHRRHRNDAGDIGACAAANGKADDDEHEAAEGWRRQHQRRGDGNAHADHAVEIAAPAGRRMGKPAQCQYEQDAGDEIEESRDIAQHAALTCPSSCTSPAFAG